MDNELDFDADNAASDIVGERYIGYEDAPIPDRLDRRVSRFIKMYIATPGPERERVTSTLTRDHARVLTVFAERMATLAVRTKSDNPLREGLVALGAAAGHDDDREVLLVAPLYRDSASAIGADAFTLFSESARYLEPVGRRMLTELFRPSPSHPTIADMGYELRHEADGPRYVRNW